MFEESLVESTPLLRLRNRWPVVLSFAVQALVLAALISIPLLHPDALGLKTPPLISVTLPPPPRPLPPPPKPLHVVATVSSAPATSAAQPQAALAPALRPSFIPNSGPPVDAPSLSVAPNLGGPGNSNPFATLGGGPEGAHVVVARSEPNTNRASLHISQGVSAGLLLEPIHPEYPAIAKLTRTEGTVVVQAFISKTGHIESAHVLSGSPMLQASALQAVRDARYRPYLLNNEPTEVETTITINFRLND